MDFIEWLFNKNTWNTPTNEYTLGVVTLLPVTIIIIFSSYPSAPWLLLLSVPIGLFWALHGIWRGS